MDETNITITKYEYDDLNRIKYKYETILSVIFNNTYLNYSGELDYYYNQIDKMIKLIEPTYYKTRLKQLNEKEVENND